MIRKTFPVGMLGCNCTILGDETSKQAIVIDPGDEVDRILRELVGFGLRVVGIVHTHAHIDHVGGLAELARITGAPTYLHNDDQFLYDMLPLQARMLGIAEPQKGTINEYLRDDQVITFGEHELGVLHTPGHTPGSVCFHLNKEDLCFSGDTLFRGGIGRTDLWGGDSDLIVRSIHQRLYSLNGAVEVIPGHGPATTIDRERVSNPYVRG
jgi:hydroxyacylglutathione hydrolase